MESTKNVLIIEDSKNILFLLSKLLKQNGYHVFTAIDSNEASLVFDDGHCIDMVVLDINLPGVSGYSFAESILEKYPEMKILLISGMPAEDRDILKKQHVKFLQKPYSNKVFLEYISSMEK